ncbi:Uncharacterised protein [Mycobacteroides abscessus subsp. abscessus]|nr:Uncharacterised protein [Mycobacteroides abscessus subsp. abscessus]
MGESSKGGNHTSCAGLPCPSTRSRIVSITERPVASDTAGESSSTTSAGRICRATGAAVNNRGAAPPPPDETVRRAGP